MYGKTVQGVIRSTFVVVMKTERSSSRSINVIHYHVALSARPVGIRELQQQRFGGRRAFHCSRCRLSLTLWVFPGSGVFTR